jgi:uncharacterized damage-inducible protein DinB
MMQIFTWVERKFNFDSPEWMYPNIVERVRGTPARAEDIVRDVPQGMLTKKPADDKWSIQENLGHLLSLEPLWATRLDQLVKGLPELLAWEETNRSTWEADYISQPLDAILTRFREARMQLVRRLDHLDDSLIGRTALHPRLKKPMRTIDLVFFVAEHDDYHLAQAARLKKEYCGS